MKKDRIIRRNEANNIEAQIIGRKPKHKAYLRVDGGGHRLCVDGASLRSFLKTGLEMCTGKKVILK